MKLLILFLLFTISANASYEKYHSPKTDAENALDVILKKQIKEENQFYAFLTDFSNLNNENEKHKYYKFFTRNFVKKIRMMEESLCDAETRKLPDMKCTIDVNPITQNPNDSYLHSSIMAKSVKTVKKPHWTDRHKINLKSNLFLYKTYAESKKKAVIEHTWEIDKTQVTVFKMKKEDGRWKIDEATPKR